MSREHGPEATVVSLECARFEDGLAEGRDDESMRAHEEQCPRCAQLADELRGYDGILQTIAEVTAARPLPANFTNEVLRRGVGEWATGSSFEVTEVTPQRNRKRGRKMSRIASFGLALASLAAGAVLALAIFGAAEESDGARTPHAVVVARGGQPDTYRPGAPDAGSPQVPWVVQLSPDAEHTAPAGPAPVVTPAERVPEPSVNIPGELHAVILRAVRDDKTCPKQSGGTIRVSFTIDTKGRQQGRMLWSSELQGAAHRCLNDILDRLLLPPLSEPAAVTLDLSW